MTAGAGDGAGAGACLVGALLSPSTGIIDSHGLHARAHGRGRRGAAFAFRAPFAAARPTHGGFEVEIGGAEPMRSRGARSTPQASPRTRVARSIEGLAAHFVPETLYAKGNYFALS